MQPHGEQGGHQKGNSDGMELKAREVYTGPMCTSCNSEAKLHVFCVGIGRGKKRFGKHITGDSYIAKKSPHTQPQVACHMSVFTCRLSGGMREK